MSRQLQLEVQKKSVCCRVGYIFASFEVVYLCVSMLLSLHHCFQCSVCDVEQVCKYSIFLTLFAVFVHCFHGGYYELTAGRSDVVYSAESQ